MGFLRLNEVVKLRCCDIIINKTSIFIEKSNTDVDREGSWVYLTELGVALVPLN